MYHTGVPVEASRNNSILVYLERNYFPQNLVILSMCLDEYICMDIYNMRMYGYV